MKFILRSLLVLTTAVGLGILLYFAIQALPNDARQTNPLANGSLPQLESTASGNPTSRPDRPGNNRVEGIRWGAIGRVARRALLFSAIVFAGVLAKNFLFGRESKKTRRS